MALESFDTGIDIRDLNIETPREADGRFDLDAEVSEKRLVGMLETALHFVGKMDRGGSSNEMGPRGLAAMMVLAPEKVRPALTEEVFAKMNDYLNELYEQFSSANRETIVLRWLRQFATIRMLFPNRVNELKEGDMYWGEATKLFDVRERDGNWMEWGVTARFAKLAFPDRDRVLNLDEKNFYGMKQFLDADIWTETNYIQHLADARILFPERFTELKINKDKWRHIRQLLHDAEHQRQDMGNIARAEAYAGMQILAADEVSVDSSGLHLTMPLQGSGGEVATSLPQRRKF